MGPVIHPPQVSYFIRCGWAEIRQWRPLSSAIIIFVITNAQFTSGGQLWPDSSSAAFVCMRRGNETSAAMKDHFLGWPTEKRHSPTFPQNENLKLVHTRLDWTPTVSSLILDHSARQDRCPLMSIFISERGTVGVVYSSYRTMMGVDRAQIAWWWCKSQTKNKQKRLMALKEPHQALLGHSCRRASLYSTWKWTMGLYNRAFVIRRLVSLRWCVRACVFRRRTPEPIDIYSILNDCCCCCWFGVPLTWATISSPSISLYSFDFGSRRRLYELSN